ncbi:MAG: hypothetical protein M5R40_03645 [Anaerolineae bacterium]|nr:hypothetical protein [Anaerolineae bacterium]
MRGPFRFGRHRGGGEPDRLVAGGLLAGLLRVFDEALDQCHTGNDNCQRQHQSQCQHNASRKRDYQPQNRQEDDAAKNAANHADNDACLRVVSSPLENNRCYKVTSQSPNNGPNSDSNCEKQPYINLRESEVHKRGSP